MGGIELRKRRLEKGLTQGQLAALVGVSQAMISQLERGERPVPQAARPLHRGGGADEDDGASPPLAEDLRAVLDLDPAELQAELRSLTRGRAPRGPYRSEATS